MATKMTLGGLSAMVSVVAAARFGSPARAIETLGQLWPIRRERAKALEGLRRLDAEAWQVLCAAAYTVADKGEGAPLADVAHLLGYSLDAIKLQRREVPELNALRPGKRGRPAPRVTRPRLDRPAATDRDDETTGAAPTKYTVRDGVSKKSSLTER